MKLPHLLLGHTLLLFVLLLTTFFPSQQTLIDAQQESRHSTQQAKAVPPMEPLTNNDGAEQSQELTTRDEQVQAQDEELEPISGEEISSLFIDDDNVINGGTVERLLRGDLDQFIGRITALEQESDMGANRTSLLGDTLSALTDTRIYSQQFGCTGRICALTLVTDNLSQQVTDKIAKFDDNYTFIRRIESENGDIKFQAIYLQTDDPSTMSFRQ